MKKNLLLIIILFVITNNVFSQTKVRIPDNDFRAYLVAEKGGILIPETDTVLFDDILSIKEMTLEGIPDVMGIGAFTNLTSLICRKNSFISLDLSNNYFLDTLICSENRQLINLDLPNSPNLTLINIFINELTSLDVSNNPNLTHLFCEGNKSLTSLDLSNNINLTHLFCTGNQLTTLDLSNNTNLTQLVCSYNQLTSLDLSNNLNLTEVVCVNNQLTSLNLANNSNLRVLNCLNNRLTSLDLSHNFNLTSLSYGNEGYLTPGLDLSNNPYLTHLTATNMGSLDLSNNPHLKYLDCTSNQFTNLDLSENLHLEYLSCLYNPLLTSLDLSNNYNLIGVDCISNQLTSLELPTNSSLEYLNCSYNQLTNLELPASSVFNRLNCDHNQLKSIDLSRVPVLEMLECMNNEFTSLDISCNPYIGYVDITSNPLEVLYVWQLPFNPLNIVYGRNANLQYRLPTMPSAKLIAPAHISSVASESVNFTWESLPNATSYYFEVSSDSLFTNYLANVVLTDTFFTLNHVLYEGTTYYWRIRNAHECISSLESSSPVWSFETFSNTLGVNETFSNEFILQNASPNPFNENTTLSFAIPVSGKVKLSVYDVTGREILVLVNEVKEAGKLHQATFHAEGLPQGIYFSKLECGDKQLIEKMVLAR